MQTRISRISFILAVLLTTLLFAENSTAGNSRPPGKETRREARMMKKRGKQLQQEGQHKVRESRNLRKKHGSRKEARQLRQEGRLLKKRGKLIEEEGRLLRQGKISPESVKNRKRHFWMREENNRRQLR